MTTPAKRDRVSAALKDPAQKNNRDHVDIIIALGMAKEGFDWIWCEHALTVGYRQPDRDRADHRPRHPRRAGQDPRPLHQPDRRAGCLRIRRDRGRQRHLKAIAASLLMEQVLAPRFEFKPKNPDSTRRPASTTARAATTPTSAMSASTSRRQFQIEIKGLAEPKSKEAARICQEDLNEVIATFVQDKTAIERGLFDESWCPRN
jgi:hypothetical protein